jgi:glycosyltransferase involved in cell wall biosynthesis
MSDQPSTAVIILAFNESIHLTRALDHIRGFAREIFVIDSFSTDNKVELARAGGAQVLQHPLQNYARQFEWEILGRTRRIYSVAALTRLAYTHSERHCSPQRKWLVRFHNSQVFTASGRRMRVDLASQLSLQKKSAFDDQQPTSITKLQRSETAPGAEAHMILH